MSAAVAAGAYLHHLEITSADPAALAAFYARAMQMPGQQVDGDRWICRGAGSHAADRARTRQQAWLCRLCLPRRRGARRPAPPHRGAPYGARTVAVAAVRRTCFCRPRSRGQCDRLRPCRTAGGRAVARPARPVAARHRQRDRPRRDGGVLCRPAGLCPVRSGARRQRPPHHRVRALHARASHRRHVSQGPTPRSTITATKRAAGIRCATGPIISVRCAYRSSGVPAGTVPATTSSSSSRIPTAT